ncbi:MAG: hypothetical protein CVU59_12180 [Deltaproteobacteria bacterium HGW-Deltaproteobacteria-17]|nr:MAG: hypothetical protein CVU59_12180 [Deltaproteobacteria bacterium HGW-Deltaproteobacteria-17]
MKISYLPMIIVALSFFGCSLMVEVKDPPANNGNNVNNTNNGTCGDGIAQPAEACDKNDLRGKTCETQGYPLGGTLKCTGDCTLDYSNCVGDPTCGDNIRQGTEMCDGEDLGGSSCGTMGFPFGTLRCAADCSFDTSDCRNADCSKENFEACNTTLPNQCCPNNGHPSECVDTQTGTGLCMQQCTQGMECSWSMDCVEDPGVCYYAFCGPGTTNQDLNGPCVFSDLRVGTCDTAAAIAKEPVTTCNQGGMLGEGGFCDPINNPWSPGVGEQDFCAAGLMCLNLGANPPQGVCVSICNPELERIQHSGLCTGASHCVNLSTLILDPTDPRFLLRTPDRGVCLGDVTCDLSTGYEIISQMTCTAPSTCQMVGWGSLTGSCSGGTGTGTEGSPCSPGDTSACVTGLVCTIADPLHDPDPLTTDNYACRKPCDASLGEANNPACQTTPTAPSCITTSRFFTTNHELPNNSNFGLETSPSPLGFCLPPP